MNRVEAYQLLSAEMDAYRRFNHSQLLELIEEDAMQVRRNASGIDYDISISVLAGTATASDIVVHGTIALADWGGPHDRLDESFKVDW